jgi:flavin reductase (DIM6/NTAB) family NADH-FMN oxidoreductase RutF
VSAAEEPATPLDGGREGADPRRFREALGSVTTPVAVVTSFLDGRPHGSTVRAFCPLSHTPPLVLVALPAKSDLLALLRDAGTFAVNLLATGQQDLARSFARPDADPFAGGGWALDGGVPRLDGAAGWVLCRLEDLLPGGDHLIATGHVVRAEATDAEPLLYRRRAFGTLAGLPTS